MSDDVLRVELTKRARRSKSWLGYDAYDVEDCGYDTPCWIYRKRPVRDGYAQMSLADGRQIKAHRAFYLHLVGPIPEGLTLDHLCRVRRCVNPAHMEPVTRGENVLRGFGHAAVNARKTHCIHGHPFDDSNTHVNRQGKRVCRACRRKRWHERKATA